MRRLRRRLLWAGLLYGLAFLYVVASALRASLWLRDVAFGRAESRLSGA
jgi:hypothetical protein